MRFAIASLFTLLVVGMASAVPDETASTAYRLSTASQPAQCELLRAIGVRLEGGSGGPTGASRATWDELRAAARQSATPSAETVAHVTATLHELIACLNARDDLRAPTGSRTPRAALLWVGELWMLPDGRVAAPIITRREVGVRAEAWSLVVLQRLGDRYVVDSVQAVALRSGAPASLLSPSRFGSS